MNGAECALCALVQAVEDTAKNLLQQEQQRYGWQIEALQQLLLQARQQLQSQQQASLRASAASGALKGSAGGAPSAALAAKNTGPAGAGGAAAERHASELPLAAADAAPSRPPGWQPRVAPQPLRTSQHPRRLA